MFSLIDVQLDNNDIGIIIVVSNTKYIDKPSHLNKNHRNLFDDILVQIEID